MEIVLIIIFIGFIWLAISKIVERYEQKVRDKVAHEILDDRFDFKEKKNQILRINQNLGFADKNKICPICGGNLFQRNSNYGSFLGCANYPKCRFTKSIY